MDRKIWKGRVDDETKSERFHQFVAKGDLKSAGFQEYQTYGLLGFNCDLGVIRNQGRPGARHGPDSIRKSLANMCIHNPNFHLYDFGNVETPDSDGEGVLESCQTSLGKELNSMIAHQITPVVLGGGHETAWGTFQGIFPHLENKNTLILNFDAHFDLRDGLPSSGTPFLQISQHLKQNDMPFNYTCIGVQNASNTNTLFNRAEALGVNCIPAEDCFRLRADGLIKEIEPAVNEADVIYLSFCMDVYASYLAPGVSAPQVLGLTPELVLPVVSYICHSKKVLASDIVELNPQYDQGNQTAQLAAQTLRTILLQ